MQLAYEKIIARLIETIEQGTIFWRRPWTTPVNAVSGKPYRGINFLVLATSDFADPRYLTYRQAKEFGGHVKTGARGFPLIKWHFPDEEEMRRNPDAKPFCRCFTVFNTAQCDNMVKLPELPSIERNPIAEAQTMIENWSDKPRIEHGGYQAAYNPILDMVRIPEMKKFCSPEAYYDTLFHEMIHSTGHYSRLDRDMSPRFEIEKYGLEELIAEIGAAMLCAEAGIDNSNIVENNAAYLQSWLRAISADPSIIVRAAGGAAKAADMILGRGCDPVKTDDAREQREFIAAA